MIDDFKARQLMTMDLIENILNYAENPGKLGEYITQAVRELVGAKVIAVLQHIGKDDHRIISICPERWLTDEKTVILKKLAHLSCSLKKSEIWGQGKNLFFAEELLSSIDCRLSIITPLKIGTQKVGVMLILDLIDTHKIDEISKLLDTLSTIIALIIKNSLFYEQQEAIITERTEKLRYRLDIEGLVANISTRFINIPHEEIDSEIIETLKTIAKFLNVEKCHLNLFSSDLMNIEHTYEWNVEGVKSVTDIKVFSWLMNKLKNFENINITTISQIPEEAISEINYFRSQNIKSIVSIPLNSRQKLIGYLGFNTKTKERISPEEDITLLKMIGNIFINVIERKKAEEEKRSLEARLRQSQKIEAIGTLAGGIAHDFNNILGAIIGYTELSLDDIPPDSIIHTNLTRSLIACNRAKNIVKQILSFSHPDKHEKKPLKLGIVLEEAITIIISSIPSTIEIRKKIEDKTGLIMGEPTHIYQILYNLCINAAHSMKNKTGIMEISLKRHISHGNDKIKPGQYLMLTVSDTGCGMTSEIIERIFEPYFTTKVAGEGTGMGLSIVYGIVRSYDGHILVKSEPEKGTTFHIFFPEIKSDISTEKQRVKPRGGTERILFVDDEKDLFDLAGKVLTRLGYNVTATMSSIDALNIFRSSPHNFDLLITDQTMPKMTGLELAREVININPDIPIILCTGLTENINRNNIKANGIKGFIMKPFTMVEIAKKIRDVIDG